MPATPATLSAIEAAVRASGFEPGRVRLVARLDCEVWRIACRGGDVCLRIYRASRIERAPIEAEVAWLRLLADEGVHVPRPLADGDGRFIRSWQPDPAGPPRHAVLLAWLGGRMHDRGLTPRRLHRVGVLAARLHAASARLVQAGAIATARRSHELALDAWCAGAYPGSQALGERLRAGARAAAARLRQELDALPRDPSSWGFIHGDLHPWNLLFEGDRAGAIDFSDCGWGHRAFDLASTLHWLRHPLAGNHDHGDGRARLQDALLEGYASAGTLPPDVERQIDLFIVQRLLLTLEWMLDDWPRLDHRPWGPGFLAACGLLLEDWSAQD
jgi:Ser/Thr protein kinase RdoA (MazF antagonist)